ncbi:hypothetical protein J7K43_00095 [Candidatus Calescamantes bacterium]|nr:hypothetical protein [Candidatus Calescamantes bacterium]
MRNFGISNWSMKGKYDIHVHSYLDDGGSEMHIKDIVEEAEKKFLDGIGIVMHYRETVPDVDVYRQMLHGEKNLFALTQLIEEIKEIKRTASDNLEIKVGIETEIKDLEGNLNASQEIIEKVDFVIFVCHWIPEILPYNLTSLILKHKLKAIEYYRSETWHRIIEDRGRSDLVHRYFGMYKRAMLKFPSAILGHPHFGDLAMYKIIEDLEDVHEYLLDLAETMVKTNTTFNITELMAKVIENPSIDDCGIGKNFWNSLPVWINICKEKGVKFLPGSDAHSLERVGQVDACRRILRGYNRK